MSHEEPLVYSIEEAAALLRIGRNQCYAAARRGEIPVIRIGPRRMVVPKAALERMLAEAGQAREQAEAPVG